MSESASFSGPDESAERKKIESGRLTCSAEELLDMEHPLMAFISKVTDIAAEHLHDSDWQCIASLLSDKRKLKVSYPFTDKKVSVSIPTYFKELAIGLFKKARFPILEDDSKNDTGASTLEEIEAINLEKQKEVEGFCMKSLKKALTLLVDANDRVSNAKLKVDQDKLQKKLDKSTDIFIIRTNNLIGLQSLPVEDRQNYIRMKVKDDPRDREEVISRAPEDLVMLYLYDYARRRVNEDSSDIEQVYHYLLLLDPQMSEKCGGFNYEGVALVMRFRTLLHEAVNYALAITFNDQGEAEDKAWIEYSIDITKSVAARVFEVLIADSFSHESETKRDKKHPKAMAACERNFTDLKRGEIDSIADLQPIIPPAKGAKKWKFPQHSLRKLMKKITLAGTTTDFLFIGLMNLLRKRQLEEAENR